MKGNKLMGGLLLVVALVVLVGQFVDLHGYWWDVDYLTIAICGIAGVILLRQS